MVAVAVAAILVGIAVPALSMFVQNSRESTEADSLMTSLSYARSEAVKRDADVEVCASSDGSSCNATDWDNGWIVLTTDSTPTVLQVMPKLGDGNTLAATFNGDGVSQVTFQSNGFVAAAAGSGAYYTTYFTLCDSRGAAHARDVEVSATGAIQASSTPGQTLNSQALTCP